MVRKCFPKNNKVEVAAVQGLVVDYANSVGANVLIKGLRALSDFDYEFQLALMNRRLEREVETVFLMTGLRWIYISSSIVKDVASHGGDVSGLVPDHVGEKLRAHYTGL
jgi:pantetheine-phosphate adenylyltransferase